MVNIKIKLTLFFAAEDGDTLYSQQKQDQDLTVDKIMNLLLQNSGLKKVRKTTRPFRYDLNQNCYNYTVEGTSLVAQMVKHLSTMWETQVRSLVGKILWRRKWQPTPVLLLGKSHGWRRLIGYSPWGCKQLDTTEQLHFLSFFLTPWKESYDQPR